MTLTRETLHILLVDDDDADCDLLINTLKRAGITYRVTHLRHGEIALQYFRYVKATGSVVPHVVLLDINMPLIGGVEALKRLREESSFRDLPVIMLSGADQPDNRRITTRLGIFRFVKKQPNSANVISALDDFIGFYNRVANTETVGAAGA